MYRPRIRPRALLLLLVPLAGVLALLGAVLLRDAPGGDARGDASPGATIVFAEFGPRADRVYTAPATDPARRTLVTVVDHVEGWGINPAPAMAGSRVAYTVLPPDAEPRRDAPAELWLLDVATNQRTRLASDADLLAQPRFDRDGGALAYRSTTADGRQELIRVDLATRLRRVMHTADGGFGAYPIGFANDGSLLFATLSITGTDVHRVTDGEAPQLVVHASDQIARDWRLSPDGRELSYVAPELLAERWVHRLSVVSVDEGGRRELESTPGGATAEQFAPVWTPDGRAITVGREAYPQRSVRALTLAVTGGEWRPLPAPERGFDVPLGWSPDGGYLAARSFDGVSSSDPGRESVVVISPDGVRREVAAPTEVIFLGWLARG